MKKVILSILLISIIFKSYIKESSNNLKNLYLEKGNYTISNDVYLKLNSDYTLLLKGGVYPLYKSANSDFENVIKVPIEIQ